MFNLLPENLRRQIKKEYNLRLFIVIMSFVILVQISFLIFLFPSWLTSYYKQKDFSIRSDEMNSFLSTLDVSSTTTYIKSLNSTLVTINDSLEYPKLVPILESVLSKKTSSIRINGVFFTVNSVNTAVLTVNGVGDTREALVSFSKSLGDIESLKKVDLPISNLAKDKNIDFTININVEK